VVETVGAKDITDAVGDMTDASDGWRSGSGGLHGLEEREKVEALPLPLPDLIVPIAVPGRTAASA